MRCPDSTVRVSYRRIRMTADHTVSAGYRRIRVTADHTVGASHRRICSAVSDGTMRKRLCE